MRRATVRGLLLLTLLLGWGLRLWRLDYQELRGDETFGYFFSQRPFDDMVQATVDLQEPHPIASYLVQQRWLAWVGPSEFALRFTAVWFGLLAVALLWRLARALDFTPSTALLTTFLLTISPYAIWHSQDARMYSMSLALTTASTWLMIGWLQRQRWVWAIAYMVVSGLALHTHYFTLFVLAAQTLFVLVRTLHQPRLRFTLINWLSLQATIAFFYGPWLLRVQTTLTTYHGNGDSPTFLAMARRAGSVFLVGESVPTTQQLGWAILAGLLLGWGAIALAQSGPSGRRTLTLLSLYLGVPLLATWWGATQRPIFNERYLVAAAPPFYLLLAASFALWLKPTATSQPALKRTGVAALMIVALLGMGFSLDRYYGDPAYSKTRGWRVLATTLSQWSAALSPDEVRIAQNFPDPTLWYYYTGPVTHLVLPPGPQDEAGAQVAVQRLREEGVKRILLPLQPDPNWDDQGIAAATLGAVYALVWEQPVGVWPVQLYVAEPTALTPVNVTFNNGVILVNFAMQPPTLTPANVLAVHLGWQSDANPNAPSLTGSEQVFVQLLDPAGQLIAQDDRHLVIHAPQSAMTTLATYGILLPETLSLGDYRLIAGLYDPAVAGAPRVLTSEGADHIVLKTIPVKLGEIDGE